MQPNELRKLLLREADLAASGRNPGADEARHRRFVPVMTGHGSSSRSALTLTRTTSVTLRSAGILPDVNYGRNTIVVTLIGGRARISALPRRSRWARLGERSRMARVRDRPSPHPLHD